MIKIHDRDASLIEQECRKRYSRGNAHVGIFTYDAQHAGAF
jgi:hypothetical protein